MALILSMTAPVPPAHLSFIEAIFFRRPLPALFKDDDLGVLAAEFDHRVHFGMQLLDGQGDGVDLLHEARANRRGERAAAGAGDEDAAVARRNADFALHPQQKIAQHLGLARVVAAIVAPEDASSVGGDDHRLDRCGTDVHTHEEENVAAGTRHANGFYRASSLNALRAAEPARRGHR